MGESSFGCLAVEGGKHPTHPCGGLLSVLSGSLGFPGFARPEKMGVASWRLILGVLPECADGLGLQGSALRSLLLGRGIWMDGSALCGRSILVVEAERFVALDVEIGLRAAGAKVFGAHQLNHALYMAEYPALSAAVIAQRLGSDRNGRGLPTPGIPWRAVHALHSLRCDRGQTEVA